jgi:hypothetical protein
MVMTVKVPASMSSTDGPPKEATRSPATAGPTTREREERQQEK